MRGACLMLVVGVRQYRQRPGQKISPRVSADSGPMRTSRPPTAPGSEEGPEQNRSFQKFINGSVSQARVPAGRRH
jgi:hypothetical protein